MAIRRTEGEPRWRLVAVMAELTGSPLRPAWRCVPLASACGTDPDDRSCHHSVPSSLLEAPHHIPPLGRRGLDALAELGEQVG
jgi:hypothetical protein